MGTSMETTKNKICRLAKVLFNERGYDHVSLRDIADAANMTVGNLSYHFPKKEMLILTIRESIYNRVEHFLEQTRTRNEYSIENAVKLWTLAETTQHEASYYFKNLIEFGKNFDFVQKAQATVQIKLYTYYCELFSALKDQGFVRGDLDKELHASHALAFLVLMSMWQQNSSPTGNPDIAHGTMVATFADLLTPLLSEQGRAELARVTAQQPEAARGSAV